jgi:hypothetical protein
MNPFKILAIPFLAISLAACQKSDLPTDESFTDCKNCTFTYQEDARIEGFQVKDGNEVVFTYRTIGREEASVTTPVPFKSALRGSVGINGL